MKEKRKIAEYQDIQEYPTLFEAPKEWQEHWTGMPEFVQGKQREYAKIIVRFRNQKDLEEFASMIGQKLNKHSQCTWHPELHIDKTRIKKYVSK